MGKHTYSKDKIDFGPDVEVETDEVYDSKGARIDQAYVERAITDVNAYRTGRPSLGGKTGLSPRVSFRVEPNLRALGEQRARKEGKTLSHLARAAFEKYLSNA